MRWYFADSANPREAAYKQQTLAAIDAWWRAFQSKTSDLAALFTRQSEWNLPQWMHDHLGAINPALMWEFGPGVRQGGHRLVITPEGNRWLRPVVKTVLERAPQLPGWEFYAYRLPENAETTIQNVQARVGVNITGALVEAKVGNCRKIDLEFTFPSLRGIDIDRQHQAAFVATEILMGEQVLDAWIGGIDLAEGQPAGRSRALPMERAQATVGSLIRSLTEQLPATRSEDISFEDGWSNVQLEPEPAEDYPARTDLAVASTKAIEQLETHHRGLIFSSACFSRVGEWFCYLKLDASDVPRENIVEFRSLIEDALNPALLQAGVGGCIGGGSGLRYSYIDLALTDISKAVPIIRQVLAAQRAPLRSWLLFFDDDLGREWVGIYQQTPEPPWPTE
jgi:hypothetical protein